MYGKTKKRTLLGYGRWRQIDHPCLPLIESWRELRWEYSDVVSSSNYLGGTSASSNKLRLNFTDGSFIDIWLSSDGDYAYHWERRRQTGQVYRWDNAPHDPNITTFPAHFHEGDEGTIGESQWSAHPELALRSVLDFVRQHL